MRDLELKGEASCECCSWATFVSFLYLSFERQSRSGLDHRSGSLDGSHVPVPATSYVRQEGGRKTTTVCPVVIE